MLIKILIIGKNGTNGILNVLIVVFWGCLQIMNKDAIKISIKKINNAIAYAWLRLVINVKIELMIIKSITIRKKKILSFSFKIEIKKINLLDNIVNILTITAEASFASLDCGLYNAYQNVFWLMLLKMTNRLNRWRCGRPYSCFSLSDEGLYLFK